jgi:hypothetical protein
MYLASLKSSNAKRVQPKAEKPEVKEKVETPVDEIKDDGVTYTKSDINRASTATLKEIAGEIGIDDAEEKTGGELKKLIIDKLGL